MLALRGGRQPDGQVGNRVSCCLPLYFGEMPEVLQRDATRALSLSEVTMAKSSVWVVEMAVEYPRSIKWEPCCSAWDSREGAMRDLREYRTENPDDKFRLRRYVRAEA